MKIEDTFIPDGEEEILTLTIREYEFSDDIDLFCWNDAKFETSYSEYSDGWGLSEDYISFFVWLDKLPKESYSLIQRM